MAVYFSRDMRFFSDLSRNFACYVINTAGLEDIGCQSQIAGWLQAENFENSIWKSAEVIPVRILQWFSDSLRLFRFNKMNPSFRSLLYHWLIIASKWYSNCNRRFCALFECVSHNLGGNERTWDTCTQPSWVDITVAAGPVLLKVGR